MDASAVSVYDNINAESGNFSKSFVYQTVNDLLSINCDAEVKIFCPLCINSFEYKFSLFEHLRTFHNNFLTQAGNQSLKFKECPFCNAKFYGKHLTAKHALFHHSKVIRELFLDENSKCCFCCDKLEKRDSDLVVKHIEDMHFLEFEEEFRRKFSCDSFLEMTVSDLINSTIQSEKSQMGSSVKWEDVCMNVGSKHSGNKVLEWRDFSEASRMNCFDFADLKEQLESIKDSENEKEVESSCQKKPILKDIKNSKSQSITRHSVRRVLRFDLPEESLNDKENQQPAKDDTPLDISKVGDMDKLITESCESLCGEPKHSSTPNSGFCKSRGKILRKDDNKVEAKVPTFRSYLYQKDMKEFEFQCGKCRELFRENLDLVSHVKNNHKKFSFKVLQPCYTCAICSARFFKNRYLRKHHRLHKPY